MTGCFALGLIVAVAIATAAIFAVDRKAGVAAIAARTEARFILQAVSSINNLVPPPIAEVTAQKRINVRGIAMASEDFTTNALDRFFPETGASRFVADCWPHSVVLEHGALERLSSIAAWAKAVDIPDLIAALNDPRIVVYHRGKNRPTTQKALPADQALELWRDGHTIALEHVARASGAVYGLARDLRRALGYGQRTADVALIVAGDGEAVPWHFDGIELVILHLTGEKNWFFSPNYDVEHPTQAYFAGAHGATDRDRSAGPRAEYLSADLAPNRETEVHYCFHPGSAAFLPKGLWHRTESKGPSLSLTFKVPVPTARDRLLKALARATRAQAAWRAPLPSVPGQSNFFGSTQSVLAKTLDTLIQTLSPDFIATYGVERFRVRSGEQLDLAQKGGVIQLAGRGRSAMPPSPLDARVLPALQHIAGHEGSFDVADICAVCPHVPVILVSEAITCLLDNGILEETL